MEVYKSFYKEAKGQKNEKCNYTTRLDLYGKGCYYNCDYCYSKQLLDFRNLWHPQNVAIAPIEQVYKTIEKIPAGKVLRLGGMTDCFQPIEKQIKNTYNTIKRLNEKKIHYLIVTKSDLIATEEYLEILSRDLGHIQISIPTNNDQVLQATDNAPNFKTRKQTIEKLQKEGYDVSVRLSPFFYEVSDFNEINNIKCDKCLVEFLRNKPSINEYTKEYASFDKYTIKAIGYRHLPIEEKLKIINQLDFKEISLCDSVHQHYNYFKKYINNNPQDCCNLRFNGEN